MSHRSTRRDFLKQSAALGTAYWVTAGPAWSDSKNPVEKLNFACIGVGGKGSSDSDNAGRHGNVVAVCDIDANRRESKAKKWKKAKVYDDYRTMLEEMGDKIDAVTVSTPDHHHAPASIRAMRMGKHCFTQKPLTWSMEEARMMREVAAEQGVSTQMGNQGTASTGLRESVEIIRSGALGKVTEVHVWTNRPIWPQGTGRPEKTDPVPDHVKWNLWLGPAPKRPFVKGVYHPFKWRGWLDFGTGALGDMACHTMNMPVMALNLFDPVSVKAESSGIVENETYPKWSVITYEFPETDKHPALKMVWYDGGKLPPKELFLGEERKSTGSLVIGEKGRLLSRGSYGGSYVLLPKKEYKDYKKPEQTLPRSPGHFTEFANACKEGDPSLALSNFDYAGRLTETVLLGNVALRAGEKVQWDAKNLKAKSPSSANDLLGRDYREGWKI